jgi:hypothetical protein
MADGERHLQSHRRRDEIKFFDDRYELPSEFYLNGGGNDMLYILIQHDYHIAITQFSGVLFAFIDATLNEKHHDA